MTLALFAALFFVSRCASRDSNAGPSAPEASSALSFPSRQVQTATTSVSQQRRRWHCSRHYSESTGCDNGVPKGAAFLLWTLAPVSPTLYPALGPIEESPILIPVDAHAASGNPIRSASCWPIDITCRDAGGSDRVVRVKPIRHPAKGEKKSDSYGFAIAEAVSWGILNACGLHMAEPYVVSMSAAFAADLSAQGGYDPPVRAGRHWGTGVLNAVALDKDLDRQTLDDTGHPAHIFRIFLLDELMGNADRLTEGNLLLVSDPALPARLVPIDQSASFGGQECVCDQACLAGSHGKRYAEAYQVMEQVLLDRMPAFVDEELGLIKGQEAAILAAANMPHAEWYDGAGITPDDVRNYLAARLAALDELARAEHWRGVCRTGQEFKDLELKL